MNKIRVNYFHRDFFYECIDGNMLWVNKDGIIVPVKLQEILREKAISDGIDKSIFIGSVDMKIKKEKVIKKKPVQFNPFKEGELK